MTKSHHIENLKIVRQHEIPQKSAFDYRASLPYRTWFDKILNLVNYTLKIKYLTLLTAF